MIIGRQRLIIDDSFEDYERQRLIFGIQKSISMQKVETFYTKIERLIYRRWLLSES